MMFFGRAASILWKGQQSLFAIFYGKPKNGLWDFRKIDPVHPKDAIHRSETSYFLENRLLYHPT
jgi:hypothetical protein